jgi:hypothetical protein
MRKIVSKEKEAKRKKINQLIVGGILVGVMVFSVLSYSINRGNDEEENEKFSYGGFEFVKVSGFWTIRLGDLKFSFKYIPNRTEQTNADIHGLENYANKPLYIYSEDNDALIEIYRNLFYDNKIALRVQEACYEEKKCNENIPLKDCSENLIIIQESDIQSIRQQDNCVFIEGKREDLTNLSDSFLFRLIGIQ